MLHHKLFIVPLHRIYSLLKFFIHFHLHILISIQLIIHLLIYFLGPYLNIIKRFSIGNVKNNHDSLSPSIITTSNSSKSILTSCIPLFNRIVIQMDYNLHFYFIVVQLKSFDFLRN